MLYIMQVVHDALAPLPSTMAPEERKRQKRLLQQQYNQQLILATYPNGRGESMDAGQRVDILFLLEKGLVTKGSDFRLKATNALLP